MAIHAEGRRVVQFMTKKLQQEGNDQGYNLHLVHNNLSEDIAFRTVLRLAQRHGVGIYFVHVTAKEGVAAIAEARNEGRQCTVRRCTIISSSPVTITKTRAAPHPHLSGQFADDRDALIAGMLDGRISTTATDEYTTFKGPKLWGDRIATVCGGHNGIETRIPVAFTKFVSERGMTLQRFADITSTNAAKILGLYPQKGVIQLGSDADLVLLDPNLRKTLTTSDLHADSDYSIWEGFQCHGYPVMTILRGKVIVEDGKLMGSADDGRWLKRQ